MGSRFSVVVRRSHEGKILFRRGKRACFRIVALILLALSPLVLLSQIDEFSVLEGKVINRLTGEPLRNVNIVVMGTTYGGTTDQEGKFRLMRVPHGRQTIIFTHVGYAVYRLTQNFERGEVYSYDIEMFERAVQLEELEIIGRRDTEVRTAPDSYLITRREILDSGIRDFGTLLRAYVPRIFVQEDGFNLHISLTRETSLVQRYHGQQNPLIILNGVNIGTSPANLSGMIRPEEIQKVEVLRGPSAMMYGPEGEHGVIIIDTIRQSSVQRSTISTIIVGSLVLTYFLYFMIFW